MGTEPQLIKGSVFADDRGHLAFVNDFNFAGVKRYYLVFPNERGQVRSWHGHKFEGKYVTLISGSALIGAVHLETEKVYKFVLSSKCPSVLYIPPGYANGFMSLEENTILQFFSTATLEESKSDDIRFPYNKWDIWTVEPR